MLLVVAALGATSPASATGGGAPAVEVAGAGRAVGHLLGGAPAEPVALAAACLEGAPDRWLAGQAVVVGLVEGELADAAALAAAGELGGVFVLGSPGAGLVEALAGLRAAGAAVAGVAPFVSVDEEGGRVQRLAALLGPVPSARELTDSDPTEAAALLGAHAQEVAALGFTSGLAPVVDVGAGPAIGDRSFSDDAGTVVAYARPVVEAIRDAGLVPVIKHFPGHGRASADSHVAASVTPPLEELREVDLVPFRELVGVPGVAVMVGHLQVPGLTGDLPASLSPEAVDGLLREELGFDGLVLSDALGMAAVSSRWSAPEASIRSLDAGVDLVLVDRLADVVPVVDAVEAALVDGRLDRTAMTHSSARALVARGRSGCAVAASIGLPSTQP